MNDDLFERLYDAATPDKGIRSCTRDALRRALAELAKTHEIVARPMSQRNADYMRGWRDALSLATIVPVTKFYAESVNPNPKRLPEPEYPVSPPPPVVDHGLPTAHLTDGANL